MHDKNGKPIQQGDKVAIEGVIEQTHASPEYCNVTVGIGRDADHGPFNVHGTVTLNAKQVELIEPPPVAEAPKKPNPATARHDQMVDQIENNFRYHPPKPGQNERYESLREKARELAHLINDITPSSREQSLAFTHLETAVMFANAAIARNE